VAHGSTTSLESRIRDAERTLFTRFGAAPTERVVRAGADERSPRLRVLIFGTGPPVVCLHAASWFAAHWAPLCAQLPERSVYCLDMPGHGLSDGVEYPRGGLRAFQVGLVTAVLSGLGLSGVPVVGNSLGGMTALWLALDAGPMVTRVVILGVPATALPGARPDLLLSLLSTPGINRLLLTLPSTRTTSRIALRSALGAATVDRLPAELLTIHSLARQRPEFARTISTWMTATHAWRRARHDVVLSDSELGTLRQPVHFIWGEDDAFGGPEIARRAATMIPHTTVETLACGHHPQLSDPVACARSIRAALP
jgi:4,5:9,10-diseco-3-hydroxy-5,9,17-trioxoandrosta-1(10),2-diene-4-oate hydrolase